MVAPDVVARRLLALNESLAELSRTDAADPRRLATDRLLRAAVERWMQVAIEACIDLTYHVVAEEGWTPVESARAAFSALAAHGRIPAELAARLADAAGLRYLLVHDYVAVEVERLAETVREDLDDLRAFAGIAGTWLEAAGPH